MTSDDEPPGGSRAAGARLQRAIVLTLLGEPDRRWKLGDLCEVLRADEQALAEALEQLTRGGLACARADEVWASPAARHADRLGLIAI